MSFFNPAKSVKKYAMGAIQVAEGKQNENLAALNPYAEQGGRAFTSLGDLLGMNGSAAGDAALASYRTSPGYDFQLQQGNRSIENSAAARGGVNSGSTMKALQGYGQNLADQDFQQYLGNLGKLGATGIQAEGQMAGYRNNIANSYQQNYSAIGGAQASQNAGYLGAAGSLIGGALGMMGGPMGGALGGSLGKLFSGGGGGGFNQAGGTATGFFY